MLRYEGTIWRPPSEARSLILQATVGCSHNACTFCVSYKQKKYRVRGAAGIREDLSRIPESYTSHVRRVFLADGNALAMNSDEMRDILNLLKSELPSLERVSTYGYPKDVRDKSIADLSALRDAGLEIVYYGLETGDDELLKWVHKGVNSRENIEACKKIRDAGISLSITIILGLGGFEGSEKHAVATAKVLNEIDPEYIGALTLMIPKGTPIHAITERGEYVPMEPLEILAELRTLVEHLELSNCVFRTNHASNYLPLKGTLGRDKQTIIETISQVLDSGDEKHLRPGYMRGL